MNTIDRVRRFHESFEQDCPEQPCLPGWTPAVAAELYLIADAVRALARRAHRLASECPGCVVAMRAHLELEEQGEVIEAIAEGNLSHVLHEKADQRVVNDGTLIAFGISDVFDAAFCCIDEANMSKLDEQGRPVKDAAGRILKGPNFTRADVTHLLPNT